jgi:hypothetical protein
VESAAARNKDADVKGPASHDASVRTIVVLPSEYPICRAAITPAGSGVPPCCPGKFVANTVKTLVDGARVTAKRCAYSQLSIAPTALLSKGGAPTYWPLISSWNVLSAERRTVADVADLPDGETTVFLNPTVPTGASAAALEVDQIHELPVRLSGFGLGVGTVTLVPQGPEPYLVATCACTNEERS